MFNALFMERELKERVVFVKDVEIIESPDHKFRIPKGAKGSKIAEHVGMYETKVDIKLDSPIKNGSKLIEIVNVKKDFRLVDNLS